MLGNSNQQFFVSLYRDENTNVVADNCHIHTMINTYIYPYASHGVSRKNTICC